MSGYARKGFCYKVVLKDDVDPDLADQMLEQVDQEVVESKLLAHEFEGLQLGGRLVPFFSLANYSPAEQPAMQRLRAINARKWGLSRQGGNLRRSVLEYSDKEGNHVLLIYVVWETPYLGYLLSHGVSRHPGTSIDFYVRIQEKGEVARLIRNKAAVAGRAAGIPPGSISVVFGGLIGG